MRCLFCGVLYIIMNASKKILLICESPNKVRTLKSFLPPNYTVMASVGHISDIKDGSGYQRTGIEADGDFPADFEVSKDKRDVVAKLKERAKASDIVILATDPDREGESIAWSLKHFLGLPESKCQRVTYHEITKSAVLKALENPRKIDNDLVEASHARQEWDKMLGYRMSGVGRACVGARSVGRCQSAGLLLIANREDEIKSFVPERYGELVATLSKGNQEIGAKYLREDGKRPSYEECLRASEDIDKSLKAGGMFKAIKVERKQAKSNPKPPFITSTFQQEVSSRLGIGVEQAMQCAQKLFEGIDVNGRHVALISYIRTDDATLSPEFEDALGKFVKESYGKEYYAPVKRAKKSENTQAGHEAIRPVDLSMTPENLRACLDNEMLCKVYEIIYKRTLACSMAPSVTSETTCTWEQSGHLFSTTARELVFDGYRKAYSYKDKEDEDFLVKATFKEGEEARCVGMDVQQKQTNPPARYKEATFIKELERTGIGRPSTYATILKTILKEDRGYCVIQDKCIVPTSKGMELADFLRGKFPSIINIKYTSGMERDLDKIANGGLKRAKFLKKSLDEMEGAIKKANLREVGESDEKCPLCGAKMVYRRGPYGAFLGCSNYPKCKGLRKIERKG